MDNTEKKSSGNWRGRGRGFEVIDGGDSVRETPFSAEAEEHVLACCLLDGNETIARCVKERIAPGAFYNPANRLLFEVIVDLYRQSPPVTLEMLAEELKSRRQLEAAGGFAYLMRITGKIPTTSHAGYFIGKVKEKWILRNLIKDAEQAAEDCYAYTGAESENGLEELLAPLAQRFNRAVEYARSGEETMATLAQKGYERTIAKLEGRHDRSRELSSGLPFFDERFGVFDVNEEDFLIGIGAVTSGGKSTFARLLIDEFLRQGKSGMVFLLETTMAKFLELQAARTARVNSRHLMQLPKADAARYRVELDKRHAYVGRELHLYEDKPTVEVAVARVEAHLREHGPLALAFVVIDHLHELKSGADFRGNRVEELGYIAKFLKGAAKRLRLPFFVPVQLNRGPSKDGEKRRPTKHDLRGTGELENAFDRLLLLHVPTEDMRGVEQSMNSSRVMVEIIQDKSRNGPLGKREFWWDRPTGNYEQIGDAELNRRPGVPGGQKQPGGYGR